MAMSLNPDAPMYIPYRACYPSCPNTFTDPNPNPNFISYFPFYLEFHQTAYETSFVYTYSPPPFMYNYHTLPRETEETSLALVSRARVPRLRCHVRNNRRRSSKARRSHLEINGEEDFDERTTVMIKNIPPQITKRDLVAMLDEHCLKVNQNEETIVLSEFDFFYLPIDFSTGGNLGFALVNFTSPSAVRRIHSYLQDFSWHLIVDSKKICKVNYAHDQGLSTLVKRAKTLQFGRLPDDYMPSCFEPPRNGFNDPTEHQIGNRIMV